MDTSTLTKYVIITPVRDEEEHLPKTIKSVVHQTVRPSQWVLVNDGSMDKTPSMINHYAKLYPWIKTIHRNDRGHREPGKGVIEAFYDGFDAINGKDWQFIVKLDADLTFDARYFQTIFQAFETRPNLGIAGGAIYHVVNGLIQLEKVPLFHVRGATKIYRRACWNDIGGLLPVPGWDTLDEVKANMLGWQTRTFPRARVIHHRHTGKAAGMWANSFKNGLANYISGYHPLFMLFKCLIRLFRKPYFIGSLALLSGYVLGYTTNTAQVADKDLIKYLRKEQMNRLFLRQSIWK